MATRDYGEGSIYQRADGKWVASLDAGFTEKGTRKRVTRVRKSKTEATKALRDLRRDHLTGALSTSRATVKAWADQWLPMLERRVRPSTYATDAGAVNKWIVPTIGHRRLLDLTPGDVRAVETAVRDAGRTSTTARHAVSVLHRMLKAARAEGHAVPERIGLVPLPARAVHDRDAIPLDDARKLLAIALMRPDASRWVAALLQGMRQGETLGLTWDAVDLERGVLDVSWQLQRLPYADRRTGTFRVPDGYETRNLYRAYHLTRPKTAKGLRVVPLVPWMTAALTRWCEVAPANPWGLVWPMVDDRHGRGLVVPADSTRDRDAWKALQADAGVVHPSGRPYVLHEARHTAATLLMEAGVDMTVIEAVMGHSSMASTRGYLHVSQALARRAMEDVAATLGLDAIEA